MEEPKIKAATTDDIPILNKISLASKRHWDYPEEWIQGWKEDLKIHKEEFEKSKIFKLETDEEIAGFCVIRKLETQYEVGHLWLLPKFIGKGWGKLLLNESLKKAVPENAEIIVTADPNAEAFYTSQGFETFDREESFSKGRFLPVMRKKL